MIANADFEVLPGRYAFVSPLHAHLARATGSGHIVVCGRSSRAAGGQARRPGACGRAVPVISNNGDRAGQDVRRRELVADMILGYLKNTG